MLGDALSAALERAGISKERVSRWLGRPCGCQERQEKLNQLDLWTRRWASGSISTAARFLRRLIGEE